MKRKKNLKDSIISSAMLTSTRGFAKDSVSNGLFGPVVIRK